jgi:2-polyprenyl-6-methoxyphenol hydroxylase-like FAD-dependent oxidoreductase
MRVIVVGGSAAGQFTALLLAWAGHEVVLLDRDPVEPASDIEAAASAFRPAVPQFVQPPIVLPQCRLLLRQALPDVYDALLAAGAGEATLGSAMPPTLADRAGRLGDEEYTSVATRRSTFDWVLRRAVAGQPGIPAQGGVRAIGLVTRPGSPPRVVGCATTSGELAADLVVDATGRRSAIDSWLQAAGARRSWTVQAECGLAGRHRPGRRGRFGLHH